MTALARGALLLLLLLLPGCATLGQVIQPPVFRVAEDRPEELRLLGPGVGRPLGGAAIRLYARVSNPNPLGMTLSTIRGGLLLEGQQAAQVDFPLGVPLQAGGEQVIPLDISVSFDDIPSLGSVLLRAVTGQSIAYRLNGTVGVDAGVLGQPSFGPMTLLQGDVRVTR